MKSPYDDTNPHFTADLKLSDCCTVSVRHTRNRAQRGGRGLSGIPSQPAATGRRAWILQLPRVRQPA